MRDFGQQGRLTRRHVHRQGDLPRVLADRDRVVQILTNLVSNAYQYTQPGGSVTVSAHESGQFVQIDVADTGPGIPPQILEKIFTPFFTTKAQGTGLGLAICFKLIQMHNGDLRVTSDDRSGTVFTIELPACSTCEIDALKERR